MKRLQLTVTDATAATLAEIAHVRRTPLNRLIVGGDPEVMALLQQDLATRLSNPAYVPTTQES